MKGSKEFAYEWLGATWYFANAEQRDLFAVNPVKYAPQYGGYCAESVAYDHTAKNPIDPEVWRIVDGEKLVSNVGRCSCRCANGSLDDSRRNQ